MSKRRSPNRSTVTIVCRQCGVAFERVPGVRKYYLKKFGRVGDFCGMTCFGLSRRKNKTIAQKKAEKSEYDRRRREEIAADGRAAVYKAAKAAYHRRTYDPARAAEERKPKYQRHLAYLRRYYADPKNKAEKVAYDRARRAAAYGPFAEAYLIAVDIKKTICARIPDKYERARARGYYDNNAQTRRRQDGNNRH